MGPWSSWRRTPESSANASAAALGCAAKMLFNGFLAGHSLVSLRLSGAAAKSSTTTTGGRMSWRTPGPDRDCPPHAWRKSYLPTVALAAMSLFALPPAQAQTPQQSNAVSSFNVIGANVQQRANGVLAIMAYSVVPDLTSSSLSISNAQSGNPGVQLSQLTGGFTVSRSFPLYLEGAIAYSHYDPKFLATNGGESLSVPTSWNTVSGTGGIGWDFPLTADGELVLRPIFNVSLGSVTSNVNSARTDVGRIAGQVIDFLEHGALNAWGIGGSLMLDWERRRDTYEADVNLRYTNIRLQSFGGSSQAVEGSASAQVATLYARWRAPTSLTALDRPVRYVLEFSHSQYLGSEAGALGFSRLTSVGVGLELDTSAHEVYVTRVRTVVRYVFGNNVSGASLGLAISF